MAWRGGLQRKVLAVAFVLITLSRPESHGSSVGAHFDDLSRAPIARSAPRLFTSTTPGGVPKLVPKKSAQLDSSLGLHKMPKGLYLYNP
ncbi:hypothetical protein TNCV_855741 [Trichonephila clavipes]|nr:hypothetical protein TNCV_855741 [Trichonephila clavipes]